ncbi:polyprenyl synthetase family protein [bacterium]|nr:polyprenyl synthetase family protein [bacterium]
MTKLRESAKASGKKVRLRSIESGMSDDVRAYRKHYSQFLRSGVFLIDKVSAYLLKTRGKGIRPLLTLVGARAYGHTGALPESTLSAALIVELLHTASLIHDDVVDRADERRGRPSLNLVFNNKVAVLFGDFMLSRSLEGMFNQRNFDVLDLFSDCAFRLARGELVEAIGSRKLDLDKSAYYTMVSDKTASLISAACQMGPLSLGKSVEESLPMKQYGELLGIAFQIRDDLLDFGAGGPRLGKPIGLDLGQAKLTLPLIHVLEQVSPIDKKRILSRLKKSKKAGKRGKKVDLSDIIALIDEKGGIAYSQQVAVDYAKKAAEALQPLPDNEYRRKLEQFAYFAAERDR